MLRKSFTSQNSNLCHWVLSSMLFRRQPSQTPATDETAETETAETHVHEGHLMNRIRRETVEQPMSKQTTQVRH